MQKMSPLNMLLIAVIVVLVGLLVTIGRYSEVIGGPRNMWIIRYDRLINNTEICSLDRLHCSRIPPPP